MLQCGDPGGPSPNSLERSISKFTDSLPLDRSRTDSGSSDSALAGTRSAGRAPSSCARPSARTSGVRPCRGALPQQNCGSEDTRKFKTIRFSTIDYPAENRERGWRSAEKGWGPTPRRCAPEQDRVRGLLRVQVLERLLLPTPGALLQGKTAGFAFEERKIMSVFSMLRLLLRT